MITSGLVFVPTKLIPNIDTGKVKTVPFTKDMFDDLKDLVGDLIDDVNLDDEEED